MYRLIKLTILTFVIFSLFTLVFINSDFPTSKRSVIRPAIDTKDYKIWAKMDGREFCKDSTANDQSPYKALGKMVDAKVDIIYLTNVDVVNCGQYIQEISNKLYNYGLALAMNIDSNTDIKAIKGEDLSGLNLDYYTKKLKDTNGVTKLVAYLVFDDALSYFTFSERRQIQSHLRDIYTQSFIGFRFTKSVTATPDNKNPNRNIDWNEFLPRDDDGDFVITSIPVSGFKRTSVFTENLVLQNIDGEVVAFSN